MNALEILADYLKWHHPRYTVADVALSEVPGYLECLKPCLEKNCWRHKEHYHTIYIGGVGYKSRDERGQFQSPYRLWRELHGVLPVKEAQKDG